MKPIEVINATGIDRAPDKTVTLISGGTFMERGYTVRNASLNLYIMGKDRVLGPYSVLTTYVETDKGAIETVYDKGCRGEHALEEAVALLTSGLGISELILYSIMQMERLTSIRTSSIDYKSVIPREINEHFNRYSKEPWEVEFVEECHICGKKIDEYGLCACGAGSD